jgi:hypothetical protein
MSAKVPSLHEQLLARGRELRPEDRERLLRDLGGHRALPALLVLLDDQWRAWAQELENAKITTKPEFLISVAGSMRGVTRISEMLVKLAKAPK